MVSIVLAQLFLRLFLGIASNCEHSKILRQQSTVNLIDELGIDDWLWLIEALIEFEPITRGQQHNKSTTLLK